MSRLSHYRFMSSASYWLCAGMILLAVIMAILGMLSGAVTSLCFAVMNYLQGMLYEQLGIRLIVSCQMLDAIEKAFKIATTDGDAAAAADELRGIIKNSGGKA